MTNQDKYKETLEEYEGQHTNFIGNHHEDDESLEKAVHDFLLDEVNNELI